MLQNFAVQRNCIAFLLTTACSYSSASSGCGRCQSWIQWCKAFTTVYFTIAQAGYISKDFAALEPLVYVHCTSDADWKDRWFSGHVERLQTLAPGRAAAFFVRTPRSLTVVAALVPCAYAQELLVVLLKNNLFLSRYASSVERPGGNSTSMMMFGYRHSQNPETEFGRWAAHICEIARLLDFLFRA